MHRKRPQVLGIGLNRPESSGRKARTDFNRIGAGHGGVIVVAEKLILKSRNRSEKKAPSVCRGFKSHEEIPREGNYLQAARRYPIA
jgi:hypothetical protein